MATAKKGAGAKPVPKKAVAPKSKVELKAEKPKTAAELKAEWKIKKRAEIEANPKRKARSDAWREGQKAIAARFALPPLTGEERGVGGLTKEERKTRRPLPKELTEAAVEEFKHMVTLGVPIKVIAQYATMPNEYEMWYAIADEGSPLASAYASGKQLAVARLEEEIDQASRTPVGHVITTKKQVLNQFGDIVDVVEERIADSVDHRRLLVDTLKWTLSHVRPSKHGKNAQGGDESNDQLKNLFASLKSGPAESNG